MPLQVFQANNDATEVVLNKLHTPLLTRFIRIRPQTWHSGIALRLELFGCRVTGEVVTPSLFRSCMLIPRDLSRTQVVPDFIFSFIHPVYFY
jgi:neuropilin 2